MYPIDFKDTHPRIIPLTEDKALYIDPEFEAMRAARMLPLINQYGRYFTKRYAFSDPQLSPLDRCYDNAAFVAQKLGWKYCEGVLETTLPDGSVIHMAHAWCCTSEGRVIDPTGHKLMYLDAIKYHGIVFHWHYVLKMRRLNGYYGLLDGHHEGKPVGVYHDSPDLWLEELL